MQKRLLFLDNAKALLIILVVLGHLLERVTFNGSRGLYIVIYAFHMPAFIFISGLFFKKGTNWFKHLLMPYMVYQVIYCAYYAYEGGAPINLQFTTPVWILWYLLSMATWYAVANSLDIRGKKGVFAVVISLIAAFAAGYDKTIGYYFSLSRTIVYFPFFLFGAYIRENAFEGFIKLISGKDKKSVIIRIASIILSLRCGYALFTKASNIELSWFYNSLPYGSSNYSIAVRVVFMLCAVVFTVAVLSLIPDINIPLITKAGKNTLPVFIMHGIFVRLLAFKGLLSFESHKPLFVIIITLAMVFAFSTDLFADIISFRIFKKMVSLFHKK